MELYILTHFNIQQKELKRCNTDMGFFTVFKWNGIRD